MAEANIKYSEANIEHLKKIRGNEKVQRVLDIMEKGKKPESQQDKRDFHNIKRSLEAMEGYGENRWWASGSRILIVRHQLKEPMLLVSMKCLIDALNRLYGLNLQSEDELIGRLPEIRKMAII